MTIYNKIRKALETLQDRMQMLFKAQPQDATKKIKSKKGKKKKVKQA